MPSSHVKLCRICHSRKADANVSQALTSSTIGTKDKKIAHAFGFVMLDVTESVSGACVVLQHMNLILTHENFAKSTVRIVYRVILIGSQANEWVHV